MVTEKEGDEEANSSSGDRHDGDIQNGVDGDRRVVIDRVVDRKKIAGRLGGSGWAAGEKQDF
jgi:hypothetical protein